MMLPTDQSAGINPVSNTILNNFIIISRIAGNLYVDFICSFKIISGPLDFFFQFQYSFLDFGPENGSIYFFIYRSGINTNIIKMHFSYVFVNRNIVFRFYNTHSKLLQKHQSIFVFFPFKNFQNFRGSDFLSFRNRLSLDNLYKFCSVERVCFIIFTTRFQSLLVFE